ncbi:MAG: glycosyltransferase family 2 protein [Solobacterium sp.]|nr:glycosyltransferase family 2 protein [Solobacterium sp.]
MREVLVSIVIPTYHRPDRIARAVESALKQTCEAKEIIVVDDNGKDSEFAHQTKLALQPYLDGQSIQYIQNEVNEGGSFSRNVGLREATGKYITFLDDDDEIHPEKLEKQIRSLEERGETYSACYTGYHKLLKDGEVMESEEKIEGYVYPYALARAIYVGSGSNLLVRTEIARKIGGYDVSFKRNQDLEFLARMVKDYQLAYVDEDLLTIHYEVREVKRSYEELVAIDTHYLNAFKGEIAQLSKENQDKIYHTIALERWRYALQNNQLQDGLKNLRKNHVPMRLFFRYLRYLMDRVSRKKSYGFKA